MKRVPDPAPETPEPRAACRRAAAALRQGAAQNAASRRRPRVTQVGYVVYSQPRDDRQELRGGCPPTEPRAAAVSG